MPARAREAGATSITTDAEQHSPPIAYSIKGAARAINVSRTWLYDQIRMGHLKSRKIAGRRLVMHQDLMRFVRDGDDAS